MAVDYWNPLWRDEDYAKNTRWGGITAPPMYLDADAQITYEPEIPPSLGRPGGQWLGEDWEFFRPVHVDDSFRCWCRRPQLVDITSLDGKGPRAFQFLAHDVDILNQRDEIISKTKLYLDIVIMSGPPPEEEPQPVYRYTKEELAFIDRVFSEEEIRGGKIRWWEDVNVGEELRPAVMGPTTIWDQLIYVAGRQHIPLIPMMEMRRREAEMMAQDPATREEAKRLLLDPATGVTHHGTEFHILDSVAQAVGMPQAVHYGVMSRQTAARCVTNWMGDDGFIKSFHWRHLGHFYHGDTIICRGKVTDKRVENGEHLVDISLRVENMRGYIAVPAVATVSLLSKEAL
jgi:acyl dehydratase